MSDDKSDKAGGWFSNPLPIVMVVLLAGGLLVKNVPLESARPTDPERVKFAPTSHQDVEARLWQDPFAAVEQHEKSLKQAIAPEVKIFITPPTPEAPKTLNDRKNHGQRSEQAVPPPPEPHTSDWLQESMRTRKGEITIVAVSVLGGSFNEAAESRRRSRFAVVSALGRHEYHPEDADAIGYFRIKNPTEPKDTTGTLTVPFEWFGKRNGDSDKTSHVLVLWLDENKLFNTIRPLYALHNFVNTLTPLGLNLSYKLIGPAGSEALVNLVRENTDTKEKLNPPKGKIKIDAFSPSATISICDLNALGKSKNKIQRNCSIMETDTPLEELITLPIVRTTGTDDVLSSALLWELWQRGVNRDQCDDGLVLIGERDTAYGRTLLKHLEDGFSARCVNKPNVNHNAPHADKRLVRTLSYLRGLDGVRADSDKSGSKAPPKDENSKSKDLRAQLEDAPPEHAEGRSQFDYLRRLADEIDRLDDDKSFSENGVKAIGLVGTDLYDKLIILQALRDRFKTKIFFTTDLDARYLHADQKDWTRNLVVASNFGLSLNLALQGSTLPFRDSYQTATYLATLMALDGESNDYWTDKMKMWRRPQIFEIGRTEAVHLASPSVERLKCWTGAEYSEDSSKYFTCLERIKNPVVSSGAEKEYSEGSDSTVTKATCSDDWKECKNIEPLWPRHGISSERLPRVNPILS